MKEGDQLYKIRHSAAHALAQAVQEKYPNVKMGVGPATDDGFYYDFDLGGESFSPEDLKAFEKRMKMIIKEDQQLVHTEVPADDMIAWLEQSAQPYKVELATEFKNEGNATLGKSEMIGKKGGVKFTDLCGRPHVESTKEIGAIKLLSIAGAYWRGDEKNAMLQRIYGTAFATQEELDAYLHMLDEAKKRDHRKLGKELDLFTFSDLVGSGLPLFTPKGTLLRELVQGKIRSIEAKYGYEYVTIPHITKKELYETSGHWDKYKDSLFHVRGVDSEFVMKPMNCPHHTQIFASRQRSYRDLPQRYAEVTMVYRDEQAGELLGISRVRSITQDDGHLFVRPDQMKEEIGNIVKIIKEFYSSLGMFTDGLYRASLSVRDPKTPEKYLGDEANWQLAEQLLEGIAKEEKIPCERMEGEAAFYGPKLDFMFKDAIGREWQLGTVQVDFVMPSRFGLEYVDSDGSKKAPVMIHRAIAGSLERFLSVIIEHFAGAFPVWLSPVQVAVLPVGKDFVEFAGTFANQLKAAGVRVTIDDSDESIGKKIRLAEMSKAPYMVVVGLREASGEPLQVRVRGQAEPLVIEQAAFVEQLRNEASL
jgi:threonyl-tRNA synthetase